MEATQKLRLLGRTDIVEILPKDADGLQVVFWEDIQDVFPKVQYLLRGRVLVDKLRSGSHHRIEPLRIMYEPGVILDVVLSVPTEQAPTAVQSTVQEPNSNSQQSESIIIQTANATGQSERPSIPEKVTLTTSCAASTPPPTNVKVNTDQTSPQQTVKGLKVATDQINKKGVHRDRAAIIQEKAGAIFTQMRDFDCTIPRFFVVLPEEAVLWDPSTIVRTKFRLYFVCTCGGHAESTKEISLSEKRVSGMLHLPEHEGYVVKNPASFFREYGPFLMVALETLKESLAISNADAPFTSSIETAISERAEYSLKYLQNVRFNSLDGASHKSGSEIVHLSSYLADVETWDKVALDQLGSHLESHDSDDILGNMFHVVTEDGRFNWVCRDEYRSRYREKDTQNIRDVVERGGGRFNEQLGKIEIPHNSGVQADTLYKAILNAKRVLDLGLHICDIESFEGLPEAVERCELIILRLDLTPRSIFRNKDTLPASKLFPILLRIQELSAMQRLTVSIYPMDYMELFALLSSRSDRCSPRCKLELEVSNVPIYDDSMRFVAKSLKLSTIHSALKLRSCNISCKQVQLLAEALTVNSTLTVLDLENNHIKDNGVIALAAALRSNSSLTTLNLSGSLFKAVGIKAMAESLKTNWTLTTLLLKSTNIGPAGAKEIAILLKENNTLLTLDLDNTSIEVDGAIALAEALKSNWTLVNLAMASNHIQDKGAHALFEALEFNQSLTSLSLEYNSITHQSFQQLAKLLESNSVLSELRLGRNSFTIYRGNQLGTLAQALRDNSTLTELHLQSSRVGDALAKAFADALKVNTTLRILNLGNNKEIGQDGALALAEVLKTTKCNIYFATVA